MRIHILGTGTSTGVPIIGCRCTVCTSTDPRDHRLRCSSLIEVDDDSAKSGKRRILIDCGPYFREQMLRTPFEPLDAIFITHEHYDHVGGLDDLRPFSVFGNVVVYGETPCNNHLRERIPYCFTPKDKRYPGVPSIDLEDIEPHVPVKIGNVEVMPIRIMHGRLPILGYRIGPFAYITDMSSIDDTELPYLQGVRVLILNALRHEPHPSHQRVEDAIQFSERLGRPETYLIHLSHHILPHAQEERRLPSHVHLAYDGQVIDL